MEKILMPGPSFLKSDEMLLGWDPGPLVMMMLMMTVMMITPKMVAAQ